MLGALRPSGAFGSAAALFPPIIPVAAGFTTVFAGTLAERRVRLVCAWAGALEGANTRGLVRGAGTGIPPAGRTAPRTGPRVIEVERAFNLVGGPLSSSSSRERLRPEVRVVIAGRVVEEDMRRSDGGDGGRGRRDYNGLAKEEKTTKNTRTLEDMV